MRIAFPYSLGRRDMVVDMIVKAVFVRNILNTRKE
jgi:hypothetical protein